jgi:signal recognition particle receptor subunit beta
MVQVNPTRGEVFFKIVYYGPGLSGKTTNLEMLYKNAPKEQCSELKSLATEDDRTLFFDFMSLDLGEIQGMKTTFQLYTVPGQVYYNATREIVLQGVDGIVFVADSHPSRFEANQESLKNLEENLKKKEINFEEIPFVLQYNKRDCDGAVPIEELNRVLNPRRVPYFEASAIRGVGVFPTLKVLTGLILPKNTPSPTSILRKNPSDPQRIQTGRFQKETILGAERTKKNHYTRRTSCSFSFSLKLKFRNNSSFSPR